MKNLSAQLGGDGKATLSSQYGLDETGNRGIGALNAEKICFPNGIGFAVYRYLGLIVDDDALIGMALRSLCN
jgi:hypothetical protein